MIKTCVICGKEFEARSSIHITCGKECHQKQHNLRAQERRKQSKPILECKLCGKQFLQKGKEQFCSEECRNKSRRLSEKACKQKILQYKYESGEIKKRITPEGKAIKSKKEIKTQICPICGKEFKAYYGSKYCSDECRKAKRQDYNKLYSKKHKEEITITCKTCGKEFKTTNKNRVYCSNECYIKSSQQLRDKIYKEKHITNYGKCPICGNEFPITWKTAKYCSDICREQSKQQKIKPEYIEKQCIICGEKFLTKSRSTLCCSEKCHKKHRVQAQMKYLSKKKAELTKQKDVIINELENVKLQTEKNKIEKIANLKKQRIEKLKYNLSFTKYIRNQILEYCKYCKDHNVNSEERENADYVIVSRIKKFILSKIKIKDLETLDTTRIYQLFHSNYHIDFIIDDLENLIAEMVYELKYK